MNIEYKLKTVSKIYIILLSLIVVSVLAVGTAFARYLTQSEHNIGFSAAKPTKIYLNQTELMNKTLVKPQLTENDEKINAVFTLTNFESETNPEAKKTRFHLRAFVLRQDEVQKADDALPLQVTVSDDVSNLVFPSKSEKTVEKSEFYKNNQKNGDIFRFYDSENFDSEKVYELEGEEKSSITFNISANNVDFDMEDLFICVELVK